MQQCFAQLIKKLASGKLVEVSFRSTPFLKLTFCIFGGHNNPTNVYFWLHSTLFAAYNEAAAS